MSNWFHLATQTYKIPVLQTQRPTAGDGSKGANHPNNCRGAGQVLEKQELPPTCF